jgi:hypothetical protein
MSKEAIHDLLLAELERSAALRAQFAEDASFSELRALPRRWQAARLAHTHQDLLESHRFHDAAEFFIVDLYGPKDLSQHIEDVRRILPLMTKVLPEYGLTTVARAVELNVLSESFDGAMVEALGADAATITDTTYAAAYRRVGRAGDRKRQIALVALLGEALDKLTHQRFTGAALRMMRGPAKAAGLGQLQGFLERGYAAFGAMRGGAGEFVSIIVGRERSIVKGLLAGDDSVLRWRPQS